ncbi:MAG: bifunctional DNA-formamidopyrimidine glycosylase/DNA-(apurinic or apyrimidinic site) lyase [Pseudomonadota bacterium]
MPELPEVEVVRLGLAPILEGQRLLSTWTSGKSLRSFAGCSSALQGLRGQVVSAVGRRSKILLIEFETHTLRLHLGMSGVLTLESSPEGDRLAKDPHEHLALQFERHVLWFRDPRRFGDVQVCAPGAIWPASAQGVEPLSADFDDGHLYQAAKGVRQAVKPWLMSGAVVVGVGNIYASEALFRSGIHPNRQAGQVSEHRMRSLSQHIRDVLTEAIEKGGSTLRDFRGHAGRPGEYRNAHQVYGRQGTPCPKCQRPIRRMVQAQRSTFYCGNCQR